MVEKQTLMPLTKSAFCRYQIINGCLTSKAKRYWSQFDLLHKLEENDIYVSRRTLMIDIEAMRFDERLGYRAPIEFCKRNEGYYYTDEDYSISKLNLTTEEIETLVLASSLIKPYDGLTCLKNFPTIIEKIVKSTNISMAKENSKVELLIGCNLPEELLNSLNLLIRAIHEDEMVTIVPKDAEGNPGDPFLFHPEHLHQSDNVWYLAGIRDPEMQSEFLQVDLIESIYFESEDYD